ncbi:GGDEF domain-containing protein [Dactylosporangium cerinum]|uniref:GGDEF domain-containing protein n=1 Tax=Dactylosporangium cerinum TaxID=1434730 RepID=A0ABV9WEA3_9ACTN
MPDLQLLGRTLRRTRPCVALLIHALVLIALSTGPVTLPAVVCCAGSALLVTALIVAESRLVEALVELDELCEVIGELRAELTESSTDPVTGLPLRRIAEQRLAEAHTAGETVTIALIDVDDMHGVNEHYGHEGGDLYLAGIAWLLTDIADRHGMTDLVSRIGGDEFVLISSRSPHAVAAALSTALASTIRLGDGTLQAKFSAGIHHTNLTGVEPGTALGCADLAMYFAKRHGGGVAVYDASRDGTPSANTAQPRRRSRDRSPTPATQPPTSTPPVPTVSPTPPLPDGSGRHALAAATGERGRVTMAAQMSAAPSSPSCWSCGTQSPLVPDGVRRCAHCGAGLVFDGVGGWISPAEQLHRRAAEATARRVAVSVRLVAEAGPTLALSAPAGWSVTAAVPVIDGALHSIAVHPPVGSVDATAYLIPDIELHHHSNDRAGDAEHTRHPLHPDSTARTEWTVRVHNRAEGVDFPLYTDGGARAALFRTAADACTAAVHALRIEIAAAQRR